MYIAYLFVLFIRIVCSDISEEGIKNERLAECGLGKIFLINLEKDIERLEHFQMQMDYFGLPFERYGWYAKEMLGRYEKGESLGLDPRVTMKIPPDISYLYPKISIRARNIANTYVSIAGTWQSHLQVYFKIENAVKPTLIFEDDAVLDTNFYRFIKDTLPRLSDDWELLYLGYMCPWKTKSVNSEIATALFFTGMHGYIVRNGAVAQKLVSIMNTEKILIPDIALVEAMYRGEIRSYIAYPKMYVNQHNFVFGSGWETVIECVPYFGPLKIPIFNEIIGLFEIKKNKRFLVNGKKTEDG